jgi:glucokinase
MNTVGIDIGGTAVKAVCLRSDGTETLSISAEYARPDRAVLRASIRSVVDQLGSDLPDAVGLCVPGRRAADGESIELSVNVPGLMGYRFRDLIPDLFGRPVPHTVLSDAEAATLDLARQHPSVRRVLGIAIGTGIGAALLEDGKPVRLGRGSIGHLGQIDLGAMGSGPIPLGPDGGRGSAEGYLGAGVLRSRFGAGLADIHGGLAEDEPVLQATARLIRVALAIYTPDLVAMVGGVSLALRPLEPVIDRLVRTELTSVAPKGWSLVFGNCRHHAARGAALAARSRSGF